MGTSPGGARLAAALIVAGVLGSSGRAGAQQQNVGNKILGTTGLDSGVQADPGLYVVDRFLSYGAYAVDDRNGNRIPVNLALGVLVDSVGVAGILELKPLATYVGVSASVPFAHVGAQIGDLQASLDTFGLGDMYFQPLHLGWRLPHLDLVAGFGIYVPTGHFEPGGIGSLGAGQWSRELSWGATVYFDAHKAWFLSALSSYQSNLFKRAVDIRRGDSIQIQGGAGVRIKSTLSLGITGYGLWQVTDDTGADLPAVTRGARDRVVGLGPEVGFALTPIRSGVTMRYEHDLSAASRPMGQIFFLGLTFAPWQPPRSQGR